MKFELEVDDSAIPAGNDLIPVMTPLVTYFDPYLDPREFPDKFASQSVHLPWRGGSHGPCCTCGPSRLGTGPARAGVKAVHSYAGLRSSNHQVQGTMGFVNLWNPGVESPDRFSLGQVAVSTASPNLCTVEAGTHVYPGLTQAWEPRLFTYFTVAGYEGSGHFRGGYNQLVSGWVQHSRTVYPGAAPVRISATNGPQYMLHIALHRHHGNWWVWVNNEWIGYYSGSIPRLGGTQGELWDEGANQTEWFGEVVHWEAADESSGAAVRMGSGVGAPDAGPANLRKSAFMSHLKSITGPTVGAGPPPLEDFQESEEIGDIQSGYVVRRPSQSDPVLGNHFWWGGAGGGS